IHRVQRWLHCRDKYLDEFLRHDAYGRPSPLPCQCPNCPDLAVENAQERSLGLYCCLDCFQPLRSCETCIVREHRHAPLHRIQKWSDTHWSHCTLQELGLVVRLGHPDSTPCAVPHPYETPITVLHTNGFHQVNIVFCGCATEADDLLKRHQLLRARWFPATLEKPQTAFTFDVLELFHQITSVSGYSAHQYHSALQNLTDNSGTRHVPKRYDDLGHCTRYYRHLQMLKRSGRAHDPAGVSATPNGAMALQCPACPHPEINLPPDWQETAQNLWLFTLFLAIDANFRLKLKDRGDSKDPELGSGWAYFVEHAAYMREIAKQPDLIEKSDCDSTHRAIERAHLKSHNGYTVTGVGAVICGRHGLIRANGVGDLQVGERYSNMDYIFLSSIISASVAIIMISYDIACQWSKNIKTRVTSYPIDLAANFFTFILRYVIPKFHLPAHGPKCQCPYSLNYLEGCARLDGEGIERGWAHLGPYSSSHKEKTAANRHDSMDDLFGSWNWRKIKEMGTTMINKLHTALQGLAKQEAAFMSLSEAASDQQQADWLQMITTWQLDPLNAPNPFQEPEEVQTQSNIRRDLDQQEVLERAQGLNIDVNDVSPVQFLERGINLEIEILKFNAKLTEDKPKVDSSLAGVHGERRRSLIRRIQAWRQLQLSHMPGIQELTEDEEDLADHSDDVEVPPLSVKLLLPSQLSTVVANGNSNSDRARFTSGSLCTKEEKLRTGHAEAALTSLRRAIRCKIKVYKSKQANVRGIRAGTRAGTVVAQYQQKIIVAADIYRLSYDALKALNPGGEWLESFRPLLATDCKGPQLQDNDDNQGTSAHRHRQRQLGDGTFVASWIWQPSRFSPRRPNQSDEGDDNIAMRVDWVKAYSRKQRWDEERALVVEEMRRMLAFYKWKSDWWMQKLDQRHEAPESVRAGLDAYCHKQAQMWKTMGMQCARLWVGSLRAFNIECPWIVEYVGEEQDAASTASGVEMMAGPVPSPLEDAVELE
ncbi:hypothetical protein SISSUDRAFT_994515, partial [Sistotremastrum suecicum HHB10207 ss-3]